MKLTACALACTVGAACLAAALSCPFRPGVVCGQSMSPTFNGGSFYALDTRYFRTHAPERGDVIVFDHDGGTYIKRVIAGEGDVIYLLQSPGSEDEVITDWQLRTLSLAVERRAIPGKKVVKRRVPAGACYVVGDNLPNSTDSRDFGPVPVENIRGRVCGAPPPPSSVAHLVVDAWSGPTQATAEAERIPRRLAARL